MPDFFSTETMLGAVENLPKMTNTITARYFQTVMEFETEQVFWDRIDRRRRVAPFVHPLVPARVVQSAGRSVESFAPAYVKDLRRFNPQQTLKRAPGEPIGGQMSPDERLGLLVVQELADQRDMIDRRKELMAIEALYAGQVTVSGEDYETTVVNFGRDAALTPTPLAGTAKWNSTAPTVLKNIRTWGALGQQKGFALLRHVIMDPETLEYALTQDNNFYKEFDTRNVTNATLTVDGSDDEGLVWQGRARGFEFFAYSAWYIDDNGTEDAAFGPGKVIMTSPAVGGVQAHGAIQDLRSLTAGEYFVKSWENENPSAQMMLMQSAPLPVPVRKNVSLGVQVY